LRFAMAETLAHLEYLVSIGRLMPVAGSIMRYAHSYDVL
jgi:hypothetical protein